mmetsp:Transcript_567/g.1910  ORF Transcript_567/g.1910 Transcript_567/m.1910 type:complete len:109 (+) Transcript_567:375-701(+)
MRAGGNVEARRWSSLVGKKEVDKTCEEIFLSKFLKSRNDHSTGDGRAHVGHCGHALDLGHAGVWHHDARVGNLSGDVCRTPPRRRPGFACVHQIAPRVLGMRARVVSK